MTIVAYRTKEMILVENDKLASLKLSANNKWS